MLAVRGARLDSSRLGFACSGNSGCTKQILWLPTQNTHWVERIDAACKTWRGLGQFFAEEPQERPQYNNHSTNSNSNCNCNSNSNSNSNSKHYCYSETQEFVRALGWLVIFQ